VNVVKLYKARLKGCRGYHVLQEKEQCETSLNDKGSGSMLALAHSLKMDFPESMASSFEESVGFGAEDLIAA
jgi:hypothetical protein